MTVRWSGATVECREADITRLRADSIVNAANSALRGGGGVDGAVHAAAGPSVMAELRQRYGSVGCPTGSAVVTGAGDLDARSIIHAVGPIWRGGSHGEPELLASAYRTSLDLAAGLGAVSVAFPAISCGVYGYPLADAAQVACRTVRDWLVGHPTGGIRAVTFALRGADALTAFSGALDEAARDDTDPVRT